MTSRAAFTIVELIVVISVIVLILAIALPGLSAMGVESRFNAATQTINGALTRAYYAALSDVGLTALRFVPGQWDFDQTAEAQRPSGRQHLVTYSYTATSAADPLNPETVWFGEYFQRREGSTSIQLPKDVWVAPLEALDTQRRALVGDPDPYDNFGADFVLDGTRGEFWLDAAGSSASGYFLQADDFLIVFDPQTGVRGVIGPTRLKAYVPAEYEGAAADTETDRDGFGTGSTFYQRYNFSGIALYRREPFVSLGDDEQLRQAWLLANSRPFLVHRFGGGLVMGAQGAQ